jgi:hypothetical protein
MCQLVESKPEIPNLNDWIRLIASKRCSPRPKTSPRRSAAGLRPRQIWVPDTRARASTPILFGRHAQAQYRDTLALVRILARTDRAAAVDMIEHLMQCLSEALPKLRQEECSLAEEVHMAGVLFTQRIACLSALDWGYYGKY